MSKLRVRDAFKKSFHIPVKVFLLELIKYLVLFILLTSAYIGFFILLSQVSPVLDLVTGMKIEGITELAMQDFTQNQSHITGFIIKVIILAILAFIFIMLTIAFFDYTTIRLFKKQRSNTKSFLKLLGVYAIINALSILILIGLSLLIKNPYILATLFILLTIIYTYLTLYAQACYEHLLCGLKRAHYILIPLILLVILIFLTLVIHSLLLPLLKNYILIPLSITLIIISTWIRSFTVRLVRF